MLILVWRPDGPSLTMRGPVAMGAFQLRGVDLSTGPPF
jgi:hypothetical protein